MDSTVAARVPPQGFYFDEPSHTYWLDSSPIPGFSEILKDVDVHNLDHVPPDRLERARQRGHYVHLCAEWIDRGIGVNWEELDPGLVGRVKAWESFVRNEDFVVDPKYIEQPTYHKILRYGITPDRLGYFGAQQKRDYWHDRPVVVEIKNQYSQEDYWRMQTAAQVQAVISHTPTSYDKFVRLSVNLKDDASYVLEEFSHDRDWHDFLACLKVYNLKRKK